MADESKQQKPTTANTGKNNVDVQTENIKGTKSNASNTDFENSSFETEYSDALKSARENSDRTVDAIELTPNTAIKPTDHDVVLHIPELKVEQIKIKVKNLQANVSQNTRLREMVKMNVGVEAHIDSADIKIDNVRTEAHLKFRLKRAKVVLNKTVQTLKNNPGILRTLPNTQSNSNSLSEPGEELNKKEIEEAIQKRVTKSVRKDEQR